MKLPNFGNIIPPKIALKLVRDQIRKQIKQDFDDYTILYYHEESKIDYVINGKKYFHDDDGKLVGALKLALASQIPNDSVLDVAVIDFYDNSPCMARIGYRDKDRNNQLLTIKF